MHLQDAESCQMLVRPLESKMITEFNISGNPLGKHGSCAYSDLLANCQTLKHIDLSNTGLTSEDNQFQIDFCK